MSKKSRVVKTYGRHKHRTVKAQIWLSPDENVHSPFGNGFPSKIEASSSKNVFKPKSSKWWDTSLLFLVKTASFYRGEMRTLIGANRWMTFSELYRPFIVSFSIKHGDFHIFHSYVSLPEGTWYNIKHPDQTSMETSGPNLAHPAHAAGGPKTRKIRDQNSGWLVIL